MNSFYYEAIKSSGETVTGKLDAENQTNVVERLRSMGLMVTEVKEVKQSSFGGSFKFAKKVKLGDLSLFSRQLAAMINSGIPLTRALFTLSTQVVNRSLGIALGEVARSVESGTSFSDALEGHPAVFSELYVNMVSAGEAGGTLEATLTRLSHQLQKDKELRDSIKSASFYPMVVFAFALIILFAMLFFLVPIFVGFFPEGAVLPLPTQIIVSASDGLKAYWYIIIPFFIVLGLLFRTYAKSSDGKRKIDRLKFRLPVVGQLVQKTVIASFARTFSTMMATGIPVVQALDSSGMATGNSLVMDATKLAGEKIQEGSNVSQPLVESGIFPPMVTHMISVGEETGNIPDMMDKVAEFYEEEVATMTKGLTALIEPLMLIVVGILVGGMLIALYLPIFTVITQM
jgi:type IV pilus assembly protein PilC